MEETIRPERAPSSYAPASLATNCNRAESVESNSGETGAVIEGQRGLAVVLAIFSGQRSARAFRRKKAIVSGTAVSASPTLWMRSARRATLPLAT
jgi:hypothetical protein